MDSLKLTKWVSGGRSFWGGVVVLVFIVVVVVALAVIVVVGLVCSTNTGGISNTSYS